MFHECCRVLRPEGVFLCVSRKFAGCRIFRLVLRFDGVNYSSSSRGRMRSRRPLKYRPLDANGHLLKWWVSIRSREPFEMRCFSGDALPKHVATFSQTTGSAMMKHTLADHRVRELPFSLAPASIHKLSSARDLFWNHESCRQMRPRTHGCTCLNTKDFNGRRTSFRCVSTHTAVFPRKEPPSFRREHA